MERRPPNDPLNSHSKSQTSSQNMNIVDDMQLLTFVSFLYALFTHFSFFGLDPCSC